jgi:aminoglycoside phosphotransferase (APT) family kinase protein
VLLPRTVDELTPQWLTAALSLRHPDVHVTEVETVEVIWGTSTKVRIRATYAGGVTPGGPPERLCVKGAFHDDALATVDAAGTKHEADFFADLAPKLTCPLPNAWYAGADGERGVVIFDDLAGDGVTFGAPTRPWAPAAVGSALSVLAELHGHTWNSTFDDLPWLVVGNEPVRRAVGVLFSEQHWAHHFAQPESPTLPAELADRERALRAYHTLWLLDDAATHCVTHGDAHVGNTYVLPDGRPYFLDWASPGMTPWSGDVAYFLCGALSVADRRQHEEELVRDYVQALAARGGPALAFEDAWLDYRLHLFHGLIWATVPPRMQSVENVSAMAERYAAAILDHDVLKLLEV